MYNLRDRENRSGFGPCSRPFFSADRPYSGMGYISPLPRFPCFSRPGFSGSYSRSRRSSIGGTACSRSRYSTRAFYALPRGGPVRDPCSNYPSPCDMPSGLIVSPPQVAVVLTTIFLCVKPLKINGFVIEGVEAWIRFAAQICALRN